MVRNRFASDSVASDRPRKWLSNIGSYAAGPQDRFNKLKECEVPESKTQQRVQRNRETLIAALREVRAEAGMKKSTTLVRPSDAHFIGLSPEFPPCPFGECDGSSWYIERGTRARIECRCAQTTKASATEAKPVIDAAS
jgi:hypothetical protein